MLFEGSFDVWYHLPIENLVSVPPMRNKGFWLVYLQMSRVLLVYSLHPFLCFSLKLFVVLPFDKFKGKVSHFLWLFECSIFVIHPKEDCFNLFLLLCSTLIPSKFVLVGTILSCTVLEFLNVLVGDYS